MSYQIFFDFSVGLSKPIHCPAGKLDSIRAHVESIEAQLDLRTQQYKDNPRYWTSESKNCKGIDNKVLCAAAEEHNGWVRMIHEQFAEWSEKPVENGDVITPEVAKEFWHGLTFIHVPPERWTGEYYEARMETLYEVMRGRPTDGIEFGADGLTTKQCNEVMILFSEFLDTHDIRLAVPNGRDCLKSSYDGGYTWCELCGAVDENDLEEKISGCRRRKCPIKAEYAEKPE